MVAHLRMTLACGIALVAGWLRIDADISPPILIHSRNAIMPLELQDAGIEKPTARVRVMVSPDGNVFDAVCIEASHRLMAERAEAIARECVFIPAKDDGVPIKIRYTVNIHFEYQDSASSITTVADDIGSRLRNRTDQSEALVFQKADELDEPLSIVERPPPVLVQDEHGEAHLGTAVIEGYVDQAGRFRFLHVVESDDRYVAEAAIENFSTLRFQPPRYKGGPATTVIRLPFIARP